jgi:hypothetical protein
LYEEPVGVTLEDPCAYTENYEMGSSSTGSSLNWWCKIASATPPLIDVFKKITILEFTELEKEKEILKWGAMSKSPCQIFRNREYTRSFYFSKKNLRGAEGVR